MILKHLVKFLVEPVRTVTTIFPQVLILNSFKSPILEVQILKELVHAFVQVQILRELVRHSL
jgi:hypothetical protein